MSDETHVLHAGRLYRRVDDGRLVPAGLGVSLQDVDVVICRRVCDYPAGIPAGFETKPCDTCRQPIAYDPHGQDRERACYQCMGLDVPVLS